MRQNKSPWLHNFKYERQVKTLTGSHYTDICVLGGGIAGVSTAFMLLKNTDKKVILIEGNLLAHGATGHNAGYVEAEFEKPFKEIVKEYGLHTARDGKLEIDNAWNILDEILESLNLPKILKTQSKKAFCDSESFIDALQEEYLKYGKLNKQIYLIENTNWLENTEAYLKEKVQIINEEEFKKLIGSNNKKLDKYKAMLIDEIAVINSAHLTEDLAKFCLKEYSDRFEVFENSFINSVRLLQNGQVVLDATAGVCLAQKVILCTNGFENFGIYGPINTEIDSKFHHDVTGLIGYMMATFVVDKKANTEGGKFFPEKNKNTNEKIHPIDIEPYIYYTKRKFTDEILNGELISMGGPQVKLSDRKTYKKDHEFDEKIYQELEKFQDEIFGVKETATFKWHGLMGYTKTGIRMVGQDKKFLDLYYNLGCNGIGILPSLAGALRIAQLISGKKFNPSIFDPR